MNIHEALSALDTADDDHWTAQGLPKTEIVSEAVGETVTRAQITEAAPLFTRENTVIDVAPAEPTTPAEPNTDPDEQDNQPVTDVSNDTTPAEESKDDDGDAEPDEVTDIREAAFAQAGHFEDGVNEFLASMSEQIIEDCDPEGEGKNHPEVLASGIALELSTKILIAAQAANRKATDTHERNVQKHSPLVHTAEQNQHGIMAIIKAGQERDEKKFKDARKTADAMLRVSASLEQDKDDE